MPTADTIVLLRVQSAHAASLLRSSGGVRDLRRALRGAGAVGIGLVGSHTSVRAIAAGIRKIHPKLAIAMVLPASQWLTIADDQLPPGPLLKVVENPTDPASMEDWRTLRRTIAKSREDRTRWALDHAVACQMGDWRPKLRVTWAAAKRGRTNAWYAAQCATCGARPMCPGASNAIVVTPLPVPLSNQFDCVPIAGAESRPTVDGGRISVVVDGTRRDFRVDPGALGDNVVATAVVRGQLYLDVANTPLLTDFATQTRLLEQQTDGTWRPQTGDPFAAEEATLLQILTALRGRVLDIGAGPVRYVQMLRAAIATGAVEYMAVEPDLGHIAGVQQKWPQSQVVQGVGEALPVGDEAVDHALMLRSYNHLRDPTLAIEECARVLKKGGQLIAVDNVVFGLCRSAQQLAAARAIDVAQTPFEHYRNANGDEAAEQIAASGLFDVVRCDPVVKGTANQWLVVARRRL